MKNIEVSCPHCNQTHICNIEEKKSPSISGPPKNKKEFGFLCPIVKKPFYFEILADEEFRR